MAGQHKVLVVIAGLDAGTMPGGLANNAYALRADCGVQCL